MAKFGPFPAPTWSEVVGTGIKLLVFHWESTLIINFWLYNLLKGQKVAEMAKFGPFPAPLVVGGGWD